MFVRSKKLILLGVFFIISIVDSFGQSIGDYQSNAAIMNWNSTTQWQTWNGLAWVATATPPSAASGIITIRNAHTVTITAAVSNSASIIIAAGGKLQTAAAITLTNNAAGIITNNGILTSVTTTGVITNNGAINNNLTFSNTGIFTNNLTLNNATGANITTAVGGKLTNTGTFTNIGSFTNNATAANSAVNTGTINNSGSIINSPSGLANDFINNTPGVLLNSGTITNTVTASLVFNTGTTYKHNYISTNAATGIIPVLTWNAGSTCEILACGNSGNGPTGLNQPFKNFTWNYTTQPIDIKLAGLLQNVTGNLTINSTSTFALTLKTTSGFNTTVSGNVTINSGDLVILNNPNTTACNGLLSVGGTFTMNGGSCSLTKSTGSAIGSNGNGTLIVGGLTTINAGTLNVASSVWGGASGGEGLFTASGGILINGGTINICASGSTGNVGKGTIDDAGAFTMSSGILNLCSSTTTGGGGNGILNIGGNFTHTGGTVSKTGSNTGTININGATATNQLIESTGFTSGDVIAFNIIQSGTGYCNIAAAKFFTFNAGTTLTIYDNPSAATDFITNGTLTANTNTWSCDIGSGTNVASAGVFLNNSTGVIAANSTASTLTFASGGIFRVGGDGGEVATATWNALSIVQVQGIITATTLGNGGQSFGKIDWNSTAQTSSCDFGAAGFGAQTDYTLTSTGTGTLRFPDVNFIIGPAVITLANRLILTGSSKLQLSNGTGLYATGNRTFTINGNVSITGTALLTTGPPNAGAGSYVADQTKNFNLVVKRNFVSTSTTPMISYVHRSFSAFGDESYTSTFTFNGAMAQTVTIPVFASNMITVSGDGIPNSGTDDEFQSNNIDNFVLSTSLSAVTTSAGSNLKAKSFLIDVGTTLTLGANFQQYSLLTTSGAVDNPSTTINGAGTAAAQFGTIDMSAFTLTDASGTGTFTLNSYAKLITKNTLGITSSGATGSIQVGGVRSYNSNSYYKYNATAASQVTGNGLPATITGTLDIANTLAPAAGGVTLSQATTIQTGGGGAALLTFSGVTNGRLITTLTNLITIGDNAMVTPVGGTAAKFVDGPIKKTGNDLFIFPTGDVYQAQLTYPVATYTTTAKWARIEISAPTNLTDAFTAEYHKLNDPCATLICVAGTYDAFLNHVSYKEYWDLTRNSAAVVNPTVKLYWENGSTTASLGSGIQSLAAADLRVAELIGGVGGVWTDKGAGTTTGVAAGPGTIISNIATSFTTGTIMPFTFGANTVVNPLPIELLAFTGYSALNGNQLNWSTATEINNDHFDIERSADGMIFNTIGTINGNGNSTSIIEYDHLDASPFSGISYYRLKQVDYNGDFSYSNIIAVDRRSLDNISVHVYPNPTSDIINIISSESVSSVFIYNMLGELVYESAKEEHNITFTPLAKGIYVVKATSIEGKESMIRFIKK